MDRKLRPIQRVRQAAWFAALALVAPLWAASQTPRQEVTLHGVKAKVWASSELASPKEPGSYGPGKAFDGNPATAWVEGAVGAGKGEWIEIELDRPREIVGVVIWPGYLKTPKTLVENAVPSRIEVLIDGRKVAEPEVFYEDLLIEFPMGSPNHPKGDADCFPSGKPVNFSPRVLVLPRAVSGQSIRLAMGATHRGTKFDDMAISDISLVLADALPDGPLGAAIQQTRRFAARDTAIVEKLNRSITPDLRKRVLYYSDNDGWQLVDRADVEVSLDPTPQQALARTHCRKSAVDCWIGLVDTVVVGQFPAFVATDGGHSLVGKSLFPDGGGGWVSLYSALEFDKSGVLASLKESVRADGDQDCNDLLLPKKPKPRAAIAR